MVILVIHPNNASTKIEATTSNILISENISNEIPSVDDDEEINDIKDREGKEENSLSTKLESLTVEQLKMFAKENSIEIKSNMNKADIIKSILELQS